MSPSPQKNEDVLFSKVVFVAVIFATSLLLSVAMLNLVVALMPYWMNLTKNRVSSYSCFLHHFVLRFCTSLKWASSENTGHS